MKRNLLVLYGAILLIPVFINYGLLSWSAPGVYDDPRAWLGFLGSFLGIIGAISIAIMNARNQTLKDEIKEIKAGRSYVILTDFNARADLESVVTHENSRLIETPGYEWMKKQIKIENIKISDINTSFLKISQVGNSKVILNCSINIEYKGKEKKIFPELKINIGAIEQDIEVFVPIVPENIDLGKEVSLVKVIVEYITLMGEKMKYTLDYDSLKESHSVVDNKKETILIESEFSISKWTYPNKLKPKSIR
ncbi:hypothetical protein [Cytobacillus praedii]|uniref:Uncharacterized protein n=1 Tax=Cytobacillus praedii TaxID=1742358 RepID=A0A4V2NTT9_9BACI|nr:hypothetical protein [Cytobacillus praedii]TCJ01590.1 hypothetical protein E0Y62_23445 [Cytobacillus praedii]